MIVTNIKKLCKRHKITISQLEKSTSIANGAIAKWEKSSPKVSNIKKVADYFGVTVDELIK